MRRTRIAAILTAVFGVAGVAHAAETITYTYDAKGRLVKVQHAGTVNHGVEVNYAHDKADNRTGKTVTGAP